MKYLKTYESSDNPKVGDFVLCKTRWYKKLNKLIENKIGEITNYDGRYYKVDYIDSIPNYNDIIEKLEDQLDTMHYYSKFRRDEIIFFSNDKDVLEAMFKYNL